MEVNLAVEADGGQHSMAADARRSAFLESRGIRILRFWNNDILANPAGVLQTILAAAQKEEEPSPCPLPHAGEER